MTARDDVLENHTLVVRDGRILDILPHAAAADRYAAAVYLERSEHVLLPGLVNARTQIAPVAAYGTAAQLHDGALLCIADMLKAGTTCICALGHYPEESVAAVTAQGLRAVVGMPIAETATPWARNASEHLTRALNFRDEFRGHPTIATAFALHEPSAISDATFGRVATLADELDAGILIALHESRAEVEESMARHGLRPIERMNSLGLLTPALTAAHMVHVNEADIAMARHSGIAVTLCATSNLRFGSGQPPVAAWAASGLRLGLGSGSHASGTASDLWSEMRLLALLSRATDTAGAMGAWETLAAATRGGAAALGLDGDIGTLETGKWADLCCVELRGPAMRRAALDPMPDLGAPPGAPGAQLVFNGSRDLVSDVWVSGRHLLDDGAFTRLDWPELATRTSAWRIDRSLED